MRATADTSSSFIAHAPLGGHASHALPMHIMPSSAHEAYRAISPLPSLHVQMAYQSARQRLSYVPGVSDKTLEIAAGRAPSRQSIRRC